MLCTEQLIPESSPWTLFYMRYDHVRPCRLFPIRKINCLAQNQISPALAYHAATDSVNTTYDHRFPASTAYRDSTMATERSFNINENTSSSIDAPVFIELQETQAALKDAEAQNELKETELADMREKYGAQTLELEYTRSQLAKSMQEKADSATESTPTTGSTTDQSDSQAISPLMFLSSLSPRDPSSSSRSVTPFMAHPINSNQH